MPAARQRIEPMPKPERSGSSARQTMRRKNPQFRGNGVYWDLFARIPHDGEWWMIRRYPGEWTAKNARDRIKNQHWAKAIPIPDIESWELSTERIKNTDGTAIGSMLFARWIGEPDG